MFYGLSKLVKKLLPKQLFYRALLIVAAPIIILQITISIVFFDSLWIKTNKGLTRSLMGEIKFFISAYDNEQYNKDSLTELFLDTHEIRVEYFPFSNLPEEDLERWFSPMDRTLRRELKSNFLNYWFNTISMKNFIDLKIKYLNGYLQFIVPKDRVTNSSARIFALWITLPAFLLIIIALIFLKNQTRPIIKLAKASERFGKGEDIGEYRPSGALEIRQAGYEFDKMRKRIMRHLNQRSEMLSGISHDLRTPLTRIKLQLAFIKDKGMSKKLSDDVVEMEKMLDEYLQFSRTRSNEKDETFDISKLLSNIIYRYENNNIIFKNNNNKIIYNGRKNLITRCINNIIDNSLKYGEKIIVDLKKSINNIVIIIDDDGPGIPKNEYENVFKPFYKINKSRGDSKSSVGLGLSIASDIIQSHGGNIKLEKSSLGGLRIKIFLPF
ncbi:two-component sensor histidine kinase [Pelagibacterales bacterium SAG-MED15]|nr:two-component sensor histidine kinase [Pelagibacterales bacterium SAG-MED15]